MFLYLCNGSISELKGDLYNPGEISWKSRWKVNDNSMKNR